MKEYLQGLGLTFSAPEPQPMTLKLKHVTVRTCSQCHSDDHRRSCCPKDIEMADKWIKRTCHGRNRRKYSDIVADLKEETSYWTKKRIYEQLQEDPEAATTTSAMMDDKQMTCTLLNHLHKMKRFKAIEVNTKELPPQTEEEDK